MNPWSLGLFSYLLAGTVHYRHSSQESGLYSLRSPSRQNLFFSYTVAADGWEHQSHQAAQGVHGGHVPEKGGIPERGHEEAHDNGREPQEDRVIPPTGARSGFPRVVDPLLVVCRESQTATESLNADGACFLVRRKSSAFL
jgi:hypothetical protein